jgi:HK97 family phage major capsid protein
VSEKVLHRIIHPEIRVLDAAKGLVEYVASDETVDSYREVIRAGGWRFEKFKKNPVFLDSHSYDSIKKVIGRVISFEVKRGRLIEVVQWAVDVEDNELARIGFRMTEAGYLKAVSVGFMPVKWVTRNDSAFKGQLVELGLPADSDVRTIYTEQEQVELSACVIGANPNALANLAKARAAGIITAEEEERFSLDHGRDIARAASSRAPGARADERTRSHVSQGSYNLSAGDESASRSRTRVELLDKMNAISTKNSPAATSRANVNDYENADKPTRRAHESVALAARRGDVADCLRAMRQLEFQKSASTKRAIGEAVRRICRDRENALRIDAAMRRTVKLPLLPEQQELLGVRNWAEWNERARAKAIGETSSPGSTLIDDHLQAEIYDTLSESSSFRRLGVRECTTRQKKFSVRTARPQANFMTSEGQAVSDDANMTADSVTCNVETIAVRVNCSRQLADDNVLQSQELLTDFIPSMSERLDSAVYVGDGTANATFGGITGAFNYWTPCVAGQGGNAVQSLAFTDFLKCLQTVDPVVLRREAWWYINPVIAALAMTVREGGRSIFLSNVEAPSAGFGSICGFPVELVQAAPSTNAANAKIAAFGEPDSYVVGIQTNAADFVIEGSDDVLWNAFTRVFRGITRAGGIGRRATGGAVLTTAAS